MMYLDKTLSLVTKPRGILLALHSSGTSPQYKYNAILNSQPRYTTETSMNLTLTNSRVLCNRHVCDVSDLHNEFL